MQRNRINNVKIVWSFLIISFIILFSQNAFADLYLNSKAGYINLNTTGQTRMQITPGGNFNLLGLANVSIPGNLSVGGNASVDGSTLFVDSENNRIGIGTTRPSNKLNVIGRTGLNQSTAADDFIAFYNYSLGASNAIGYIGTQNSVTSGSGSNADLAIRYENNHNMHIYKGTGQVMTFDASGSVGIGTTTPQTELHVNASSGYAEVRLNGASGSGGTVEFYDASIQLADIYSNPDKQLIFRTNGATQQMVIDQNGNVGIGTASPGNELTVANGGDILINGTTSNDAALMLETGSVDSDLLIQFNNFSDKRYEVWWDRAADRLKLTDGTGYTDSDVITTFDRANGNVGIGTTSPNDFFQVQNDNGTIYDGTVDDGQYGNGASITVTNMNQTANSFAQLQLQTRGTSGRGIARIVAISTGSATSDLAFVTENSNTKGEKMRILGNGNVGIGTTNPSTRLDMKSSANGAAQFNIIRSGGSNSMFNITETNGGHGQLNIMDINGAQQVRFITNTAADGDNYINSGNVGIGTTGPEQTLHVNRSTDGVAIRVQDSDNFKCDINPGSGADWSCSSDARLKTNIRDIESSLSKVMKLKPRKFNAISTGQELTGFIAQEVKEVLPEMVDDSELDNLKVSTGPLIPILVKAVQELSEQNQKQQKQIEYLKIENLELKEKKDSEIYELKAGLEMLELKLK